MKQEAMAETIKDLLIENFNLKIRVKELETELEEATAPKKEGE